MCPEPDLADAGDDHVAVRDGLQVVDAVRAPFVAADVVGDVGPGGGAVGEGGEGGEDETAEEEIGEEKGARERGGHERLRVGWGDRVSVYGGCRRDAISDGADRRFGERRHSVGPVVAKRIAVAGT